MKNLIKDRDRLIALAFFGLIALLYAWTYAVAPFAEITNSIIVNGATTIAALMGAVILIGAMADQLVARRRSKRSLRRM